MHYSDDKPVYPGVDGAAEYEEKRYFTEDELKTITRTPEGHYKLGEHTYVDNPYIWTVFQPFKKSNTYTVKEGYYVWSWDGDREAPSLTPSFLQYDPRAHLYLRKGKIELLGDSVVTLES